MAGDARAALQQLDPLWDELFPAEQARIVTLLVECVEIGVDGLNIRLRVDGDLRRLNLPALENQQLVELLYSTMSDIQRRDFEANLEGDFSYDV